MNLVTVAAVPCLPPVPLIGGGLKGSLVLAESFLSFSKVLYLLIAISQNKGRAWGVLTKISPKYSTS